MHRCAIIASTLAASAGFATAHDCSSKACSGGGYQAEAVNAAYQAYGSRQTVVEIAASNDDFGTLVAAVKAAGLVDTLSGEGPFTVFAPTDAAFDALPAGTVDALVKPKNKGTLTSILTYHVVPGRILAEDTPFVSTLTTVNGQRIDLEMRDGSLFVDGAEVLTTDIEGSNGVIHVIDAVILPAEENIAEVAAEAGSFTTLLAAAEAAGLVPALTGSDEYTVFAPTDDAFAELGSETISTLLRPENQDRLKDILLYHVVPGRVYADDAVSARSAKTAQGGRLGVSVDSGRVTVNGAGVLATDVEASNGVIHVIDTVLLPR